MNGASMGRKNLWKMAALIWFSVKRIRGDIRGKSRLDFLAAAADLGLERCRHVNCRRASLLSNSRLRTCSAPPSNLILEMRDVFEAAATTSDGMANNCGHSMYCGSARCASQAIAFFAYSYRYSNVSSHAAPKTTAIAGSTDANYGAEEQRDSASWLPHAALEDALTTLHRNLSSTRCPPEMTISQNEKATTRHPSTYSSSHRDQMPKVLALSSTPSPRHHPYSRSVRRAWRRRMRLREALSLYPSWLVEILHILSGPDNWPET
ncbi:uncharacterized protein B0H18DRAFT_286743 [Fomitopsis serialis]|uniref:uncharacterized protein n=1 Tax=Fomitopsis serialis TaxID=139415 RepID=UPI002008C667|nr:uncharacterized protein B0H18DRAFT_286743 [Neoantrodia serialis]KAH9911992.1 hypothetical protein B0H18DRAFT_286743 [Neoantrodia serialis]